MRRRDSSRCSAARRGVAARGARAAAGEALSDWHAGDHIAGAQRRAARRLPQRPAGTRLRRRTDVYNGISLRRWPRRPVPGLGGRAGPARGRPHRGQRNTGRDRRQECDRDDSRGHGVGGRSASGRRQPRAPGPQRDGAERFRQRNDQQTSGADKRAGSGHVAHCAVCQYEQPGFSAAMGRDENSGTHFGSPGRTARCAKPRRRGPRIRNRSQKARRRSHWSRSTACSRPIPE